MDRMDDIAFAAYYYQIFVLASFVFYATLHFS